MLGANLGLLLYGEVSVMKNNTYLRIHMYNVIVLNNVNGECLRATSKSISLECVVSDCVYVFKRISKIATRLFILHYISAF